MYACFGISMAQKNHSYQHADERKEIERKKKRKKLIESGAKPAYGSVSVTDEEVEKWNLVNYFALDEDTRRALCSEVRGIKYKERCRQERNDKETHDNAALERKEAEKVKGEKSNLRKAAHQVRYLKMTRATTVAQLNKMLQGKVDFSGSFESKTGKKPTENQQIIILRDQIRIRVHVNAIIEPVGKGSWLTGTVDKSTLKSKVEEMIKGERFTKPEVVTIPAYVQRDAGLHADSVWSKLCEEHNERAHGKQAEFDKMVKNGTFKALLTRKPRSVGPRKGSKKARQQRREPSESEQQLVGAAFEDEGTIWQVLKLQWEMLDHADDQLVVYYYDKLAVESEDICVDDLDDEHEHVEWSSVDEIKKWVQKTGLEAAE